MKRPLFFASLLCAQLLHGVAAALEESTPAELGLDESLLTKARDYATSAGGSGIILFREKAVMRWGDQKKLYDIKSATKSFGSIALGLAIDDGKIEIDAAAQKYHPSLGIPPESNRETGWLPSITIRQLATHTAGFEKPGGFGRLLAQPGTKWNYSDGGPNWLAECLTLIYQRDLQELMFDRVFTPIGVTRDSLRWRNNSYRPHEIDGIPRREFGAGIHANVEALARIGLLYLREGEWNGKRILSRDFIRASIRADQTIANLPELNSDHGNASVHYGWLWWNNADGSLEKVPRDAYWAWGLYDSLIVVIRSLELVVVRGGENGKSLPRAQESPHYEVLKPFLEPIVASVRPNPPSR